MDSEQIRELEALDKEHFWFKAKSQYLQNLIKKPQAVILDVGCGSGGNMDSFIKHNCQVIGIDINDRAIAICKAKGYNAIQADLEKEIPIINCIPDYIIAFDFIEHIQNPVRFMTHLTELAGPETRFIVTVPAYQSLFGKWDAAMGHVKRYRRQTLCTEMEKAGWHILRSTYVHMLPLLPAIFIRKIIQPLMANIQKEKNNTQENFFTLPPILNGLIYRLYFPEFFLFQQRVFLPFGLSILAVAKLKALSSKNAETLPVIT